MSKPRPYARALVLTLPGTKKGARYLSNQETAIEVFRKATHLDEATLRPVKDADIEPATLRRTHSGAVVIHRRA